MAKICSLIHADKVAKQFGNFWAVNDLSLELYPGDVLALLGRNGAGKTTTMRMLVGYLSADRGSIKVNNLDINDNNAKALEYIGYLPEGAPLYSDLRVSEFLLFIAKSRAIDSERRKTAITKVIRLFSLEDVLTKKILELSKGFRRRVAMASAFIHDPNILILDEPTDGLDPIQKQEMRKIIKETVSNVKIAGENPHDNDKSKAIIFSTHILEEVTAMANKVAVIEGGKIIYLGTPSELLTQDPYYNNIMIEMADDSDNEQFQKIKKIFNMQSQIKISDIAITQNKIYLGCNDKKLFDNKIQVINLLNEHNIDFSNIAIETGQMDRAFSYVTENYY